MTYLEIFNMYVDTYTYLHHACIYMHTFQNATQLKIPILSIQEAVL